jgi:hypothetical protein
MPLPNGWLAQIHRPDGNNCVVSDVRAICPHCRTASTFVVLYQNWSYNGPVGAFQLVLCCNYGACKRIVYVNSSLNRQLGRQQPDDPFFMYPTGDIDAPHPSVPAHIADDWMEAQRGMQASCPKATAVMLRRVLYDVLIDKGCKLHPLKDGLQQLISSQRLPAIFDEWLPAIKDDGHDGAHPDRALMVSTENVTETLEYTSELLRFLYIEPYEFQQRKARNAVPDASAATAGQSHP